MEPRAAAAGVLLVLAGLAIMVAPIDSARTATVAVAPGNWTLVDVPAAASITGAVVEIDLLWSTPMNCCSPGEGPNTHTPDPPYLLVVDCGITPCTAAANASVVGNTSPSVWLSAASFSAQSGHNYQIWAFREDYPWPESANESVQVKWTLVEPPLGGFLGLSITLLGGVGIVHSVRRLWPLPKLAPRLY